MIDKEKAYGEFFRDLVSSLHVCYTLAQTTNQMENNTNQKYLSFVKIQTVGNFEDPKRFKNESDICESDVVDNFDNLICLCDFHQKVQC